MGLQEKYVDWEVERNVDKGELGLGNQKKKLDLICLFKGKFSSLLFILYVFVEYMLFFQVFRFYLAYFMSKGYIYVIMGDNF